MGAGRASGGRRSTAQNRRSGYRAVERRERMPDGIRIEVPVDETTLRPVTVESPLPEDMTKLFV